LINSGIKYPVYKPLLKGNEKKYVLECIDSSWISSKGKYVNLFEKQFAKFIDVNYAATVSNGTVALHLALMTLGVSEGDEVIVPTLSYISCANSIFYTGAKPVFVDSLKNTWQMDPEDVIKKITPKTKAIMAVHLYGHPCRINELKIICKKYHLFLIEDCAEAIGSKYKNKHVGTFGDIAIFSFYGNKTITAGEGGMLVTNNKTLYNLAIRIKGQGLAKNREYWHDIIGYNYRMTNIGAAIGLAQLEHVENILSQKRQIAQWYAKEFKGSGIIFHTEDNNVFHSYWMCSILIKDFKMRDGLRKFLMQHGIETRPLFYPMHTMPMYLKKNESHPISEDLARRGINLPSYPELKQKDIHFIATKIQDYLKQKC
jgi:perosamine synthetase